MGDQETKTIEPGAEAYELNLEESGDADVEEAMRSALDAVEKKKRERPEGSGRKQTDMAKGDPDDEEIPEASADDSQEVAALKERLLRTLADFDNFRKRTEREKESLRRFAVSEVIKDVLGVVDNLERAMGSSGSIEELKLGLEMILRQQGEVMRRFGVAAVQAAGMPFDPTVHEAVAREDSSDVEVPMVVRELQKGYLIHDRLLRPAMVHVAMPTSSAARSRVADDDSGQEDDLGGASE